MPDTIWKLSVNHQEHPVELRLPETAILVYEVEVRTRITYGPYPSTVTLERVEAGQITLRTETTIDRPSPINLADQIQLEQDDSKVRNPVNPANPVNPV